MLFLPGLLSPEAQAVLASRQLRCPLVDSTAHFPLRFLPCPWNPGLWDRWPRDEQMSPTLASQAHLPALPSAPPGQGRTITGGRSCSCFICLHYSLQEPWQGGRWSPGEGRPLSAQREPPSAPGWDFSPISASHPGGGRGLEGARVLPSPFSCQPSTAPEKLQSQRQAGASFHTTSPPKQCV